MKILDVCCGSKMFWWDKDNSNTTYMDKFPRYEELESGHVINVAPDVIGDFTNIPFEDNSYDLVVFDPPHFIHAGKKSWLAKKYGTLNKDNWRDEIKNGFDECKRVLKPTGTLIFKWNEDQIPFSEVLKTIGQNPIFGDRRGKTRWVVFVKDE